MKKLSALLVGALVGLGGCASKPSYQYQGVDFLSPARYVSSAFTANGGDVYIVPEKGVLVRDVLRTDGGPVTWRADGSYLVIPAARAWAGDSVDLVIDGKLRRQVLVSEAQKQVEAEARRNRPAPVASLNQQSPPVVVPFGSRVFYRR